MTREQLMRQKNNRKAASLFNPNQMPFAPPQFPPPMPFDPPQFIPMEQSFDFGNSDSSICKENLFVRNKILEKHSNNSVLLQRLQDMSEEQVKELANNQMLLNKWLEQC